SVARISALVLRPAHQRLGPRRPAFRHGPIGAGVSLIVQIQETNVAQLLRAEAADFDVVLEHREWLADLVGVRLKELALEVKAWPPRQVAADIEPLALDVQEHILREDSLRRICVVGTAGRVNVMIAAVEAVVPWVDPTLQLDRNRGLAFFGNLDLLFDQAILRP